MLFTVDQEDELQAEETAGITELEPPSEETEKQLMEPLVPVAAPVEVKQEEPEPVVEARPG